MVILNEAFSLNKNEKSKKLIFSKLFKSYESLTLLRLLSKYNIVGFCSYTFNSKLLSSMLLITNMHLLKLISSFLFKLNVMLILFFALIR